MANTQRLAKQLLATLYRDRDRLQRIDNYLHGEHDDPYMPASADDEYRLLAKRCISNWMPLVVGTPAQALYVDSFRRGSDGSAPKAGEATPKSTPEWDHWQFSRMDARQLAVHRGALSYGHSFTSTLKVKGKITTKGLSALRTAALFEDPANDDTPYVALTVRSWARDDKPGKATMWDGAFEYAVTFTDFGTDAKVTVSAGVKHGASECPITRFAASVDLEGRTVGVIEPLIALQNRINQTVFDLLVAQTYGSFKVRTVTGMAPPVQRDVETGEPVLDATGNPKPLPINHNAKRFLFAEDENVKWGSLDETPLGGYIESLDMSIRHLSAIAQVPPHHLLGQIANLSAEALQAAETSLLRKIEEFRQGFGESWERVFRLAAELSGDDASAEDFRGEVIWRDMEQKSLAQAADALGKLADQLGIPKQGLWRRVPNVTQNEINEWQDLADNEPIATLASAVQRSTAQTTASVPATPPAVVPAA